MKEKIKKYWWVILIVLVIGGAFYWFQWRPSQIRKECSVFDSEEIKSAKIQGGNYVSLGERTAKTYEQCLTEHGLEK